MKKSLSALKEIQTAFQDHGNKDLNDIPVNTVLQLTAEGIEEIETKFPNGFTNWMETFYEITSFINGEVNTNDPESAIQKTLYTDGTCGLYSLAEQWTDKFETENKGTEWDGEFFDAVSEFCNTQNKKD